MTTVPRSHDYSAT